MAATTSPRSHSWTPSRQMRKFLAGASVTLFALLISMAFLTPLGYMTITAFKTKQQFSDPNARVWPESPTTYNYQGQDYPLLEVPQADGTVKVMALVQKFRTNSNFIDPQNPDAGVINWKGQWRQLKPVYHFDPHFDNFGKAWKQVNLGILFRNTLIIAFLGTVGTLLSSVAVAYGFSRFRIPGINTIFIVLIATIILPTQVTLIPQYIFFRMIGWGGTWWPLIIPHFFANAYNVFLLRQYFRGIPKEMDESAMIDGASPFRILVSVIIPQSYPAILAVSLFHFFWAWNDFFNPLVYLQGKENLYPISVGLTQFNNIFSTQPQLAMAAAMMTIVLPVFIFFVAQRVFMQGIVITGVEK